MHLSCNSLKFSEESINPSEHTMKTYKSTMSIFKVDTVVKIKI